MLFETCDTLPHSPMTALAQPPERHYPPAEALQMTGLLQEPVPVLVQELVSALAAGPGLVGGLLGTGAGLAFAGEGVGLALRLHHVRALPQAWPPGKAL